jgi:anti-sigma factor RsiW
MSAHVDDRLPLAAAGVLAPDEAEMLDAHVRDCPACARQAARWRGMGDELRRMPQPRPTAALVARTRAAVEARFAARAEQAWNRAALGFLVAFAWTMAVGTWAVVDLVRGALALRLGATLLPTAAWYLAYVLVGWLSAGAAAALLGRRAAEEGRIG